MSDDNQTQMVELIALKRFSHSVGSVEANEKFKATRFYGRELIEAGFARLSSTNFPRSGPWAGCTAVIIASGPSLKLDDYSDLHLVRAWRDEQPEKRKVMVVNLTFRNALWADALYAADDPWWDKFGDEVNKTFPGEKWSQSEHARKNFGTRFISAEKRDGLSQIRGVIHKGGNSGYQAVGLVHELAASRVVLLAFDMQMTMGRLHHHAPYPKPFSNTSPLERWCSEFASLAKDLERAKVRVVNASRATALTCFDRVSLKEALSESAPQRARTPAHAYCLIRPQVHYRKDAFLAGLKRIGCSKVSEDKRDLRTISEDDLLVIWNRYGENHSLACSFEEAGASVIVAENGYLAEGGGVPKFDSIDPQNRYYALALRGHNGSGVAPYGSQQRWDSLKVSLKEWKSGGEHILLCPNRSFGRPDMVMPFDWAERTTAEIKRYSNRPIKLRPHPMNAPPATPLSADLRNAWAMVIWSSSTGVHSLIEGVPVFQCGPYFVCTAATSRNIKMIENPAMDEDRRISSMLALAGAQWKVSEIASGEALSAVLAGEVR